MSKSDDSQQDRQNIFYNMGISQNTGPYFTHDLLKWDKKKNRRRMPWKGEKDPYKIWLSEVILQQTRVEQGIGYYKRFISTFPDIFQLAKAKKEKVYKLWEGLGYYTRCRNLIETAKFITKEKKGKFPTVYKDILALKGVGEYTASAIASFAYNLPYAVVDGNVFRVLARVFGINMAIDSAEGKKYFSALARGLLEKTNPGIYNQAIMDFGAVVCKPVNPECVECCFKKYCKAFIENKVGLLPLKKKKKAVQNRWFYYLIAEYKNGLYINKRTANDIWKDLYEFILIETEQRTAIETIIRKAESKGLLKKNTYKIEYISPEHSQLLSHRRIRGRFIKLKFSVRPVLPGFIYATKKRLNHFAFPRYINSYLDHDPV